MRPTVQEQLLGTCRILESVVTPCVADPYARTILEGLIANLRMLSGALPAVPGFLHNDNRATVALLGQLQAVVSPDLAASIALALARPEPDSIDMTALEQRNGDLRGLLSQALGDAGGNAGGNASSNAGGGAGGGAGDGGGDGAGLTPALHAAALAHMTARAARSPMRYVSTASTPAKAT